MRLSALAFKIVSFKYVYVICTDMYVNHTLWGLTEIKLLDIFLDLKRHYFAELTRVAQLTRPRTLRVLRKLVKQGILEVSAEANVKYYSLKKTSLVYSTLGLVEYNRSLLFLVKNKTLARALDMLKEKYADYSVMLVFGSVVKGYATKTLNGDFKKYVRQHIVRKIESSPSLSKIHLDKSYHNLDFANFTVQNQQNINKRIDEETYYDWVIVIAYYSMYHAAMALLYKMGYKAGTHLATIYVLCKECLGKTLEKKDIENLSVILELSEDEIREMGRAKERREKASYSGSVSFE